MITKTSKFLLFLAIISFFSNFAFNDILVYAGEATVQKKAGLIERNKDSFADDELEDENNITEDELKGENDVTDNDLEEDNEDVTENESEEDNEDVTENESEEDNEDVTENESEEDNEDVTENELEEDNEDVTENELEEDEAITEDELEALEELTTFGLTAEEIISFEMLFSDIVPEGVNQLQFIVRLNDSSEFLFDETMLESISIKFSNMTSSILAPPEFVLTSGGTELLVTYDVYMSGIGDNSGIDITIPASCIISNDGTTQLPSPISHFVPLYSMNTSMTFRDIRNGERAYIDITAGHGITFKSGLTTDMFAVSISGESVEVNDVKVESVSDKSICISFIPVCEKLISYDDNCTLFITISPEAIEGAEENIELFSSIAISGKLSDIVTKKEEPIVIGPKSSITKEVTIELPAGFTYKYDEFRGGSSGYSTHINVDVRLDHNNIVVSLDKKSITFTFNINTFDDLGELDFTYDIAAYNLLYNDEDSSSDLAIIIPIKIGGDEYEKVVELKNPIVVAPKSSKTIEATIELPVGYTYKHDEFRGGTSGYNRSIEIDIELNHDSISVSEEKTSITFTFDIETYDELGELDFTYYISEEDLLYEGEDNTFIFTLIFPIKVQKSTPTGDNTGDNTNVDTNDNTNTEVATPSTPDASTEATAPQPYKGNVKAPIIGGGAVDNATVTQNKTTGAYEITFNEKTLNELLSEMDTGVFQINLIPEQDVYSKKDNPSFDLSLSLKAIKDSEVITSVKLNLDNAVVDLPVEAFLSAKGAASTDNIVLSVYEPKRLSTLHARALSGGRPSVLFSAKIGDKPLDLSKNPAKLSIKYLFAEKDSLNSVKIGVLYLDKDGNISIVESTYNENTRVFEFKATGNGTYFVGNTASLE